MVERNLVCQQHISGEGTRIGNTRVFVRAVRHIRVEAIRTYSRVGTWVHVWVPLHATGRHVYIRGVHEDPQTNRKQAFFIHPSILDACFMYEAWFGGHPYSNTCRFFFRSLSFLCSQRRIYTYRHVNVSQVYRLPYVFTDFSA